MKILLLLVAKVSLFVFCTAVLPQHAAAASLDNSVELSLSDGVNTLLARLYRPPGFETSTNKFPLVLFLHGIGERGTDNVLQVSVHIDGLIDATQGTNFAAFLLAPQLPPGRS
jgi:predicted peptidase